MTVQRVLVIGDVMFDRYIFVQSKRKAPEAPIPVWDHVRQDIRPGGAANVAYNLKNIGGDEILVSLAGVMNVPSRIALRYLGIDDGLCRGSESMYKTRYVDASSNAIIMRYDETPLFDPVDVSLLSGALSMAHLENRYDMIVVSDYDKGTITPEIWDIIKSKTSAPVIVDSKRRDLRMFQGSQILKINESEYATQVSSQLYPYVEGLFDHVIVTLGKKGAELRQCEVVKSGPKRYIVHTEHFSTDQVKAVDVTGCGDTHTAALCFSYLKSGDVRMSLNFANMCATKVVQKFGTSVVNDAESVV